MSQYKRTTKYKINPTAREAAVQDELYFKLESRRVHRIVAEVMLRRELKPGEVVHHRDGNPLNNVPENLMVLASQRHHMMLEHYQDREANGVRHLFPLETWLEAVDQDP